MNVSYIHIGLWIIIRKVGLFYALRRYDKKYINSDRQWLIRDAWKGFDYKHLTTTFTFLNSVATAVWWYLFLYRGGQTQKNDRSCIFDSKSNQGYQISHSIKEPCFKDTLLYYFTIYTNLVAWRAILAIIKIHYTNECIWSGKPWKDIDPQQLLQHKTYHTCEWASVVISNLSDIPCILWLKY